MEILIDIDSVLDLILEQIKNYPKESKFLWVFIKINEICVYRSEGDKKFSI